MYQQNRNLTETDTDKVCYSSSLVILYYKIERGFFIHRSSVIDLMAKRGGGCCREAKITVNVSWDQKSGRSREVTGSVGLTVH